MRRIRESLTRWGIEPVSPAQSELLFLRETNPEHWTARFFGALLEGRSIALAAPDAPTSEVARMKDLLAGAQFHEPSILIRTGGTTGRIRWARHTWDTLAAGADGFLQFFGKEAANGVRLLPLYHVGGLMTIVRAVQGGGAIVHGDYRKLGRGLSFPLGATVSLVPTQLHRLLDDPLACAALRTAGRILLGGARADQALLSAARSAKLPIAACYGMTETAALILALTPERFLDGESGVGQPLPHVELAWKPAPAREDFPAGARRLGVRSPSLCHGYWPESEAEPFSSDPWWTPDVAVKASNGDVHIVGRLDRVIISGGENVDAERVESILGGFPGVESACVLGLSDADWGQRVVAAIVVTPAFDDDLWNVFVRERLSAAERPKQLLKVETIPRTPMGKIDLKRLTAQFSRPSPQNPFPV